MCARIPPFQHVLRALLCVCVRVLLPLLLPVRSACMLVCACVCMYTLLARSFDHRILLKELRTAGCEPPAHAVWADTMRWFKALHPRAEGSSLAAYLAAAGGAVGRSQSIADLSLHAVACSACTGAPLGATEAHTAAADVEAMAHVLLSAGPFHAAGTHARPPWRVPNAILHLACYICFARCVLHTALS